MVSLAPRMSYSMAAKQVRFVTSTATATDLPEDDATYFPDHFIFKAKASAPLRIQTHSWRPPEGKPRALAFWLHGLNGYASRAHDDKLARFLVEGEIAFYAHDQPSFGRSDGEKGRRAYVSTFSVWTSAAMQYIRLVCERPENEGLPFVILGESMGGMVVIDMVVNHLQTLPTSSPLREKWRGVALIAPGIIARELPSPAAIVILKMLAWLPCMGNIGIVPVGDESFQGKVWHPDIVKAGTVASIMADGEKTVRVIKADGSSRPLTPLSYRGAMKLSTAYAMKRREEAIVTSELAAFDAPHLLLLHGESDGNVDIRGSERLLSESRTPPERKELVKLKDSFHDLLNDPATEIVLEKLRSFVLASCAQRT